MNPDKQVEVTPEMLQQHPELMLALLMLMALFGAILIGSIVSWIVGIIRLRSGLPVLKPETWTPRSWSLADILIIAVLVVVCQVAFSTFGIRGLGLERGDEPDSIPLGLAAFVGLGNIFAMFLGAAWIMLRYQVGPKHVGFRWQGLGKHLLTGLLVGLAFQPLVYILMFAVSVGFDKEYDHPLINEMAKNGSFGAYLLGVFTAAIIAPITEEFLFRVVIQGWLQSLPFKSILDNVIGAMPGSAVPAGDAVVHDVIRSGEAAGEHGWQADRDLPIQVTPDATAIASSNSESPYIITALECESVPANTALIPPIWPAVVTGVLFGLAHWGYGLSFVPLIALGTILGLVYRATHSIWPCVLIHFMLNGSSMVALGVSILMERAAG